MSSHDMLTSIVGNLSSIVQKVLGTCGETEREREGVDDYLCIWLGLPHRDSSSMHALKVPF